VGENDGGDFQIANGGEKLAAASGHVDDERLGGIPVGDEVGVVAVGPRESNLVMVSGPSVWVCMRLGVSFLA